MKLAIFDFDGTLFPNDTLAFLLSQWKKQGYSKKKYYNTIIPVMLLYLKYKTGMKSKYTREEMRLIAMDRFNRIFTDMSQEEVTAFLDKCFEPIKNRLYPTVVAELKKTQEQGYHTILLSGAYSNVLEGVADHLNIDTLIGTKMHFKDGMFDPDTPLEVVSGPVKYEKIKMYFKDEEVDWAASTAYADSLSDLSILDAVGDPVAVEPDAELKKIALSRDWPILLRNTDPSNS